MSVCLPCVPPYWVRAPEQPCRALGCEGWAVVLTPLFPLPPDFGVGITSFHTKLPPDMENSLYSQL